MNVIAKQGAMSKVRLVDPSKLQNMDENDIVIVNRVQLNTKIVEFEIRNVSSTEFVALKTAARNMKEKERKSRLPIIGAEMRVGDVIKVFPEYKSLPKNSFAIVHL